LLESAGALTADDSRAAPRLVHEVRHLDAREPNGRDESAAKNNHGTYDDLQVVLYSLFVDAAEIAKRVSQRLTAQAHRRAD
jgi:hypothetical protein